MISLVVRPAARTDQLAQALYYDIEADEELGERFLERCGRTFATLTQFPESGAPVRSAHPALKGVRFAPVRGFDKILVFYRFTESQVEILRVLHGARDVEAAILSQADES